MIIIIREIAIAHSPQLKARAQCAYRKMQHKYIHEQKQKKKNNNNDNQEQTEYTRISQLPHHGPSYNLQRKTPQSNNNKNPVNYKGFNQD